MFLYWVANHFSTGVKGGVIFKKIRRPRNWWEICTFCFDNSVAGFWRPTRKKDPDANSKRKPIAEQYLSVAQGMPEGWNKTFKDTLRVPRGCYRHPHVWPGLGLGRRPPRTGSQREPDYPRSAWVFNPRSWPRSEHGSRTRSPHRGLVFRDQGWLTRSRTRVSGSGPAHEISASAPGFQGLVLDRWVVVLSMSTFSSRNTKCIEGMHSLGGQHL